MTTSIYDGTGKVARVETWRGGVIQKLGPGNDKLTEAKAWDRDGKLVADDQFEPDGSRKIRR